MTKFPLSVFHFKVVVWLHTGRGKGFHQVSYRGPFRPELLYDSVKLRVEFHT